MNVCRSSFVIILLVLSSATVLFAQNSGTVKGKVISQVSSEPLPGVNVIIQHTRIGTSTDANGLFAISGISEGKNTLIFSFIGFRNQLQTVQIEEGETLEITVEMRPDRIAMNGIQVSALRPDEIAESRLEDSDVTEANPRDSGELLRSIEGVDAVRRGPVGLDPVIRGLRETEIGTYLDGTRIFPGGPGRMDSPLSHFDPTAIEKIEVVKGPYALTWGSGNMSAVRVETESLNTIANMFGGQLSSGYDSNLNAFEESASFKGSVGRFGYWIHGAWREGDNYESGDGTVVPADFLSREIRAKLGYAFTPNSHMNLSFGYQNQEDLSYPGRLLNAEFFDTFNYSVNWQWNPDGGILSSLTANAYINNVDHGMNNNGKPTAQPNPDRIPPFALDVSVDSQAHVTGGKLNVEFNLGSSSRLEVGSDIYSVNRDAVRTIDRRDEGMKPPMFPLVDKMWPDATTTNTGVYSKLKKPFSDQLNMTGTVRVDFVSADAGEVSDFFAENVRGNLKSSETNLSGSYTLSYFPAQNWTLGLGLGSAVRTADATERFSDRIPASKAQMSAEFVGNPDLNPERSTQGDLWIEANYPVWTLSVNLFARQMDNYITLTPTDLPKRLPLSPDTVYRYINGDARFRGFDISSSYRIVESLILKTGLNYLWGKDTELNEPVLGIAPFTVDTGLRYESAQWPIFVEGTVEFVTEQDRVAVSRGETPTDGYVLADLKTGFTLWKQLSIQAGVENLTDQNYTNHLNAKNPFTGQQIYEPGRIFHIDIGYRF